MVAEGLGRRPAPKARAEGLGNVGSKRPKVFRRYAPESQKLRADTTASGGTLPADDRDPAPESTRESVLSLTLSGQQQRGRPHELRCSPAAAPPPLPPPPPPPRSSLRQPGRRPSPHAARRRHAWQREQHSGGRRSASSPSHVECPHGLTDRFCINAAASALLRPALVVNARGACAAERVRKCMRS